MTTIISQAEKARPILSTIKRGIDTSEFWKTTINSLILSSVGIFLILKGNLTEGVGLLLGVAGLGGTYNISRGMVKKATTPDE
mgnify:CR=1 FL=1